MLELVESNLGNANHTSLFNRGGFVALLTGHAGVGKTMTAQALAERVERPLYPFRLSELGASPSEFELNLRAAIDLAETWNAILLIDDADVLVDCREETEFLQSVMAAILLRHLDSYRGTLIITAKRNKVNSSLLGRVHLRYTYSDLNQSSRKQIWRCILSEARGHVLDVEVNDEEIEEFSTMDLNGRQASLSPPPSESPV